MYAKQMEITLHKFAVSRPLLGIFQYEFMTITEDWNAYKYKRLLYQQKHEVMKI